MFSKEQEEALRRVVMEREETRNLRGKVLRREENQFDKDYSGGGFYYEKSVALYLFENGTFLYEEKTFSTVSSDGLSMPSERIKNNCGTWKVECSQNITHLVLREHNGSVFKSWQTKFGSWQTEDGGPGFHYLDARPWNRYNISS